MNKKYLKIAFALLISGMFLAGVFFITNKKEFSSNTPSPITIKGENYKNEQILDTDLDGLQNWEEELWNTDPKETDTDKDGTNDNDEVKSGRNPIIAGPNDKLSQNEAEKANTGENSIDTNLTPTEKLGRDMFANYLALKEAGVTFDEQSIEGFVNEIVKKTAIDVEYKIYSETNLLNAPIIGDATVTKTYGNALGTVLANNSSQFENELLIFSRFSDSGDKRELAKLAPILTSYRKILGEMLIIPVPENAKVLHVSLLNSLSFIIKSLENMSVAENDPFITLLTVNQHVAGTQNLNNSIMALQTYFSQRGVDFTQNEAGYKFLHGI